MSDRDKPAPYRIPEFDPETEMLTYSSYCPLNLRIEEGPYTCKKKGGKLRMYDTEEKARYKVTCHLTESPEHKMGDIEAAAVLENEPECIWVEKCLKSEWH